MDNNSPFRYATIDVKAYWKKHENKRNDHNAYIYIIKPSYNNYYKIGSAVDVEKRIKSLQIANPSKLRIIYKSRECKRGLEGKIHKQLKKHKHRGEWYGFTKKELSNTINIINDMVDKNIERNRIWDEWDERRMNENKLS